MRPAPLTKPLPGSGRLERRERKQAARVAVTKAERRQKLDEARAWQQRRRECWERDGGKDRATGRPVPFEACHIHHLDMRSAMGTNDLSNLVTLDARSHSQVHAYSLRIAGDPNGTLTFTWVNVETGDPIRQWESRV